MNAQLTTTRPRCRRLLRYLAFGLVGLFLIALVGNALWGYVEARRLRAEINKITAADEPITLKEFDARLPKIDESQDAGPYYEAALALLRHQDSQEARDACNAYHDAMGHSPASRPASEVCEIIDRFLADNTLTFQMLDVAAQRPRCQFKIGVEAGMEHCLSRLSRARMMARLLSLQALVHLSADRPDQAVDAVVCLQRMLRMFERQPIIIAHLVKMAIASLANQDVRLILDTAHPSDAQLTLLQQSLLATDSQSPLEPVILAERAYGLELMGEILAGTAGTGAACDPAIGLPGQWPLGGFWGRPMARHMAVEYLREMNALLDDARRPLPEVITTSQAGGQTRSSSGASVGLAMRRGLILSQRATAEARCTAVAIMIERYRRANGRLPQSLRDLVPAFAPSLPVDPFTGDELAYRHDEKAYVVYSLGLNQQDDNGDVDAVPNGQMPQDFGLRIRLPATMPAASAPAPSPIRP